MCTYGTVYRTNPSHSLNLPGADVKCNTTPAASRSPSPHSAAAAGPFLLPQAPVSRSAEFWSLDSPGEAYEAPNLLAAAPYHPERTGAIDLNEWRGYSSVSSDLGLFPETQCLESRTKRYRADRRWSHNSQAREHLPRCHGVFPGVGIRPSLLVSRVTARSESRESPGLLIKSPLQKAGNPDADTLHMPV